jgi:hypothetical protein
VHRQHARAAQYFATEAASPLLCGARFKNGRYLSSALASFEQHLDALLDVMHGLCRPPATVLWRHIDRWCRGHPVEDYSRRYRWQRNRTSVQLYMYVADLL